MDFFYFSSIPDSILIFSVAILLAFLVMLLLRPLFHNERAGNIPAFTLKRSEKNPLISPDPNLPWQAGGTFNPTTYTDESGVHILYRAIGRDGFSVVGYAHTADGHTIDENFSNPIYAPREEFEGAYAKPWGYNPALFTSGGSWGGCEDPKVTRIGDRLYMTYVAHNGWNEPRVAITWIPIEDFRNRRFNWARPQLISRPGIITKSAVIMPEKINGKYAFFHRVFPNVQVNYRDSLEFEENEYLGVHNEIPARPDAWDSRKLSIGATPVRTKHGWLTIYHAVDDREPDKYKVGAMLLKHDEPHIVLHRTNAPILSPEAHYENDGKPGVVYPGGTAVLKDILHVYYGGGDKTVCVATAPMESIMEHLTGSRQALSLQAL